MELSTRNGTLQNTDQRETAFFKNGPYGNELADALALSKRPIEFRMFYANSSDYAPLAQSRPLRTYNPAHENLD